MVHRVYLFLDLIQVVFDFAVDEWLCGFFGRWCDEEEVVQIFTGFMNSAEIFWAELILCEVEEDGD